MNKFACKTSHLLKHKPVAARNNVGRRVVIFHDEKNKLVALHDVCPHRGAPLSAGELDKIDGKVCIRCPYHGWAFDAEGKLRDIPQVKTYPKRSLIDTFDVRVSDDDVIVE